MRVTVRQAYLSNKAFAIFYDADTDVMPLSALLQAKPIYI